MSLDTDTTSDCTYHNVLMDPSPLYPKGHHPVRYRRLPNGWAPAKPLPRVASHRAVKYYFIDFGISHLFPPDVIGMAEGPDGIDQDVPELSWGTPYCSFKVDIFILGNLFDNYILKVCIASC